MCCAATLVRRGCLFQSTTDSEVFVHLIAISLYSTVVDRLIDALKQVIGAYSLVALSNEALMGVRDPLGVRPLILGRIGNEGTGGWVLASETCALDIVGADFVRDVEPGEMVVINDQGVHSIKPFGRSRERFCVFEYIYFARPDSIMEGTPVYDARKQIGAELAREVGSARRRGRAGAGFRRAGSDGLRHRKRHPVRARYHPQPLCRPYLHRADRPHPPSRREAEALRQSLGAEGQAGDPGGRFDRARHHQPEDRRDGPPGRRDARCICASPRRRRRIPASTASTRRSAASCWRRAHSVDEMADLIGVDSLAFISIDGLYRALGKRERDRARPHYCDACFTGDYPIALPDQADNSERQLSLLAEKSLTALAGAIALVTGASRGIGAATAVELARLGAHVVITARTQGGLEETDDAIRAVGGEATLLPLDLAEGSQIDAIGPSIHQRFGRLDVLVHNAGSLGRLTPVAHILPNDWADVIAVNLTAAWRLIRTCDPLLRNASAGRAVFVTDERARDAEGVLGRLRRDQGGMEHLVLTWADEVKTTSLRVNLFDPGVVATRLRANAFPGEEPASLTQPHDVAPLLAALCIPAEQRHGAYCAAFDRDAAAI